MKILAIETSCDDTGIAVLEIKEHLPAGRQETFKVLANLVSSQVKLHAQYGGIYPSLAKREHIKNLPIILGKALAKAKLTKEKKPVDAIALTVGPGLDPCLWTGITFAKEFAKQWNIPIVPVDHVEGHLLISLLMGVENPKSLPRRQAGEARNSKQIQNTKYKILNTGYKFPSVALIVSGGHTQIVLVEQIGKYKIIGETLDDAAGEAFDKTARILGLPYPGGPAISKEAEKTNFENVGGGRGFRAKRGRGETFSKISFSLPKLPRPMMHAKNYDFSFSGLKTAVLYDFQSRPKKIQKSKEYVRAMAKEIQQAIIDVLLAKTLRATQEYGAKTIVLGGGVAANSELRKQFRYQILNTKYKILVAPAELCTDNGLMIALAGYFRLRKGMYAKNPNAIGAQPNLRLK